MATDRELLEAIEQDVGRILIRLGTVRTLIDRGYLDDAVHDLLDVEQGVEDVGLRIEMQRRLVRPGPAPAPAIEPEEIGRQWADDLLGTAERDNPAGDDIERDGIPGTTNGRPAVELDEQGEPVVVGDDDLPLSSHWCWKWVVHRECGREVKVNKNGVLRAHMCEPRPKEDDDDEEAALEEAVRREPRRFRGAPSGDRAQAAQAQRVGGEAAERTAAPLRRQSGLTIDEVTPALTREEILRARGQ